jgi:hypothetical protein
VALSEAGSIRDRAPARRAMKSVPFCVLLFSLLAGPSSVASAGSQESPRVRIVVLEVGATPNTLRLGVRKRLMLWDDLTLDTEVLNFNPAACTDLQAFFTGNGAAAATLYDHFDIQLNTASRSAEEQEQLLNAVLVSFMTSRNVRLYVRDDLCSSSDGRVAAGIVVD